MILKKSHGKISHSPCLANKLATTDNCNLIRSGLIPCCKVIHNISKQASHLDSTTFSKSIIGYH